VTTGSTTTPTPPVVVQPSQVINFFSAQ
jgi:hypothetical protein